MKAFLRQLPYFLWLVLIWVLLWQSVSVLTLASGALVAWLVTVSFYLPAAEAPTRFNAYRFLILVAVFGWDLARASFQVAWQAIGPRRITVSSIIQVDLRTTSDLVMAMTALAITLVPGSFVTEVDRPNTILYLHVLDARDDRDVEAMRRRVLTQEERIIRAIGSRTDLARLSDWRENGGRGLRPGRMLR